MSDLESGMATIVKVFHKYSGHKCKLRKAELKELINNEMNHFIMVSPRPACVHFLLDLRDQ